MVTSNKDAARIWAEIEKARAVGTEVTVEDAKNLNADLRKEVRYQTDQAKFYKIKAEQLAKENKELREMGKNFIDEHRNKGDM